MSKWLKLKKKIIIIILYVLFISFICFIFIKNIINYLPYNLQKRPNIILISIDTLRRDHLGIYGYNRNISPNIDKFAKSSYVFMNAYSQSTWTKPSYGSMFTGQYNLIHKLLSQSIDDGQSIPRTIKTIGEILKSAGYKCIGLTDGGFVHGKFGFNRGFDIYKDEKIRGIAESISILKFRISSQAGPFFIFLHTFDVHGPYGRRDIPLFRNQNNYQGKLQNIIGNNKKFYDIYRKIWKGHVQLNKEDINYLIDNYNHCIKHIDKKIGELFRFLKEKKLWDNSIIIFNSDHGERFKPIKNIDFPLHFAEYFLEHVGFSPLLVKVPLIIKLPFQTEQYIIKRNVSAGIDLLPTIIQELNLKIDLKLSGKSFFDENNDGYILFSKSDDGIGLIKDGNYILFKKQSKNSLPIISDGPFSFNPEEYKIKKNGIDYKTAIGNLKQKIELINKIHELYLKKGKNYQKKMEKRLKEQLKSLGYL